MRANALGSVNFLATTYGWIRSSGGDYDWRQDVMLNNGVAHAEHGCSAAVHNDSYATGLPPRACASRTSTRSGAGIMFDIDLLKSTNIIAGIRYDRSNAYAQTSSL